MNSDWHSDAFSAALRAIGIDRPTTGGHGKHAKAGDLLREVFQGAKPDHSTICRFMSPFEDK